MKRNGRDAFGGATPFQRTPHQRENLVAFLNKAPTKKILLPSWQKRKIKWLTIDFLVYTKRENRIYV